MIRHSCLGKRHLGQSRAILCKVLYLKQLSFKLCRLHRLAAYIGTTHRLNSLTLHVSPFTNPLHTARGEYFPEHSSIDQPGKKPLWIRRTNRVSSKK